MDYDSVLLVLKLVSEAFGAIKEIDKLVKRVEAGEVITDDEIKKARLSVKAAVDRWNSADNKEPNDVA